MRPELASTGADSFLEAGQVRGQPIRQLREAAGQGGNAGPDPRHPAGRHEELTGGQEHHFVDGAEAALVGGIEHSHRVDLVAEKLDPDGQRRGRWKHVHEPAAPGELAAAGHFENGVVAERQELVEQTVLVKTGAHSQAARLGRHLFRIQGVLQESLNARD